MLLVETKLGLSEIHGIGLFANQFIQKGTVTWEYHPLFDTAFSGEEVKKMSAPAQKQFLHYAYFDKDLNKYVLCFDFQRFINHSVKKLNINSTVRRDVAAFDITLGEELLCDYNKFDSEYFGRHGILPHQII